MRKIVVLGADGFIGRHLVTSLAFSHKFEIVAFGHFSTYRTGAKHPFEALPGVTIVVGDFFNREDLATTLRGADYLFHLISLTSPATSNSDPFIDINTNVRGTIELFQFCVELKIKKVVFISSGGSLYGDVDDASISEDHVTSPRSPYAIGKVTIEHYLRYFNYMADLDYIVYRVANPYGPGQNIHGKQGVIPIFLRNILEGQPITVFGDGSMIRDYIYIDDLIRMITGSFEHANKFSEYNLGSGTGSSVNQLIKALVKCTKQSIKVNHQPTPSTYVHASVLKMDRFNEEFGIKPNVSLEEGLIKTWNYVKSID